MPAEIRLIRHEAIPKCGSFEVRFSDGRPSEYFYWEDVPGRRLRVEQVSSEVALEAAKKFARRAREVEMIKMNMNLPPEVARRFVEDMEAFHAETNPLKRDEIALRQLHALREHRRPRDPKLRLFEVKELFQQMRDFIKQGKT